MNDKIHNLELPQSVKDYLNNYNCPLCKSKLHNKETPFYYDGVYNTFARCQKEFCLDTYIEFEINIYWNFKNNNNKIYVDNYQYGFIVNNNLYRMIHNRWPNMGYEFNNESFSIDIEVYNLANCKDYIPDDCKMQFISKSKYFDFANVNAKTLAKTIHRVAILR